ncbi:hypothetical protein Tco_0222005, partial [Tanacetum coccineum]
DNQGSPSSKFVNNEAPTIVAKPLTYVHPSDFVEDIADFDDASTRDNENPLVSTSLPPLPEAGEKLRLLGKRKLPSGDVDSDADIYGLLLSSFIIGVHLPLLNDLLPSFIEFPLTKELKDSVDCLLMLLLPFGRTSSTRELIYALHKATPSYDAIQARELEKDRAYAELKRRCNEARLDLDKNLLVSNMRTEIEALQGRVDGLHSEYTRLILEEKNGLIMTKHCLPLEMDALKQDRASVVAKVVLDAATKLIRSDEMGMLVAKLVKASIIYGRCATFEEVANLKEPFIMEKMVGYRPTSKQEYDQAGDDVANVSYPFLSKYVNDPYAFLEQLLSKKPESLRSKPSYVKAK